MLLSLNKNVKLQFPCFTFGIFSFFYANPCNFVYHILHKSLHNADKDFIYFLRSQLLLKFLFRFM